MNFLKLAFVALSLTVIASTSFADDIVFDKLGFKIAAIDLKPTNQGSVPLAMSFPAVNNFNASVTVQLQPYTETLKKYKALTDKSFKAHKYNVKRSEIKGDNYYVEYIDNNNDKPLLVLGKAFKKGRFVYLVIGKDLVINGKAQGHLLAKAVDSFSNIK